MAIDKNKTEELFEIAEQLFEYLTKCLPNEAKNYLKLNVMEPAFKEIREFLDEGRAPILFLVGRSGHGKSSVINALAGKKVAAVSDVKPCTYNSDQYLVSFPEQFSTWSIIDSRGFFESTKPDGAGVYNASDLLKQDINKYKPDVIMHVINAKEIRNLEKDLIFYRELMEEYKKESGLSIPTLVVINAVDTLGNPREWPPEDFPKKCALIKEASDYMSTEVLKANNLEFIDKNFPLFGYRIKKDNIQDGIYVGIIPVCALEGDYWNIDKLYDFIGEYLPNEAILDYYQARRRIEGLRKISSAFIKRFSLMAGLIGSSPIPISDIVMLVPLQMILIAFIGLLSGREPSKKTVTEFLCASGIQVGSGFGFKLIAQQLVKLIPGFGLVVSGSIASLGTYTIGKSAETYFFSGEIKKPCDFVEEASREVSR